MDIVIIGGGAVSRLHLKAYSKIEDIKFKIVKIIEPDFSKATDWLQEYAKYFPNSIPPEHHCSIQEIKDWSNYTADICTPNHLHFPIVKYLDTVHCPFIILEKPAVVNIEELKELTKIKARILLQENYLFSPILNIVKSYIKNYQIDIQFMKLIFSKDRREDSRNGRGFSGDQPPNVLFVEIPHMIGIAYHLLGTATLVHAEAEDMYIDNKVFPSHGKGSVTLSHQGIVSYHYTNLEQQKRERRIIIKGTDKNKQNVTLEGVFSHKDANPGKVSLFINNKFVESKIVIDDSLTNSLSSILKSFVEDKEISVNLTFIKNTSKLIFDSISYANNYSIKPSSEGKIYDYSF
ncbi:Gfo/Idh/MocA family protein [Bacillus nitratireducens]|uniref:Gfo/Idh/MocA family protein n=1 Tax=Bacillus nitratireducens TaxID=2026193 RepID=UPI0011A60B34|nr:Gfo/Idh/MocA family oxidoreductase [Bacillus nitratireducens]